MNNRSPRGIEPPNAATGNQQIKKDGPKQRAVFLRSAVDHDVTAEQLVKRVALATLT
jgi:hypothetical protein